MFKAKKIKSLLHRYAEAEIKNDELQVLSELNKFGKDSVPHIIESFHKRQLDPEKAALWRQLKKVETLPKKDQKALLHYLDALVSRNQNT